MVEAGRPAACDVLVVGAGLAGLTAARGLSRAGLHVVVARGPMTTSAGGSAPTRSTGSCWTAASRCSTPATRRSQDEIDLPAAEPVRPDPRRAGDQGRPAAPGGRPAPAPAAGGGPLAAAPFGSAADKAPAGRASRPTSRPPPASRLLAAEDVPAREALLARGLSVGPGRRPAPRPFFAGVLPRGRAQHLEPLRRPDAADVRAPAARPCRPPACRPCRASSPRASQRARSSPATAASSRSPGAGRADQRPARSRPARWSARPTASRPRGWSAASAGPDWHAVTTLYHVAPPGPARGADAAPRRRRELLVVNTTVLTAAAPSLRPGRRAGAGGHLGAGRPGALDRASGAVPAGRSLPAVSTSRWEHLTSYAVPRALPAMPAPHVFPPGRSGWVSGRLRVRRPPRHQLHPGRPGVGPPRGDRGAGRPRRRAGPGPRHQSNRVSRTQAPCKSSRAGSTYQIEHPGDLLDRPRETPRGGEHRVDSDRGLRPRTRRRAAARGPGGPPAPAALPTDGCGDHRLGGPPAPSCSPSSPVDLVPSPRRAVGTATA